MKKRWLVVSCLIAITLTGAKVSAAEFCRDEYYINKNMPNGARWDMCWTHDANQGVRYHHIYYQPKGGTRRMVMYDASVAQIHVPYDDNGARYHDVSDFGLGEDNLLPLQASECQGGNRGFYNGKPIICHQMMKEDDAFRHAERRVDQHFLKTMSISRVGEYLYASEWRFYADGRIVPSMLATGALQRFGQSDVEQHGWLIADDPQKRVGLAHMHNFYWRLDFDLNATSENDQVQEINYSDYAGKRYRNMTLFTREAARSVSPKSMRSWLVQDANITNRKGHAVGYEIRLLDSGQREIGPSFESFTEHDFYVSKTKNCEKVASHNRRIYACDTDNLKEYVNGESIEGEDIVTWVGVSFYHMPRSEDAPYMDAHVSQYEIVPRDWHTTNPMLEDTPPLELRLSATDDRVTVEGSKPILIDVMGNDTGRGITFDVVDTPRHGSSSIVDNKVQYVANAGFNGTDVFWYTIKDDSGKVFGARIHVTVKPASSTNNTNTGGSNSGGGSVGTILLWSVLIIGLWRQRKMWHKQSG